MKIKFSCSALLCVCLLAAALALPASAAGATPCDCGEVVHVWVEGFGSSLYYNEGTPEEIRAEQFVTDNIMSDLPGVFTGAAKTLQTLSWEPLAEGLSDVFLGIMGQWQLDEYGNSIAPLSSNWKIDPEQDHRTQPKYNFRYDFRIDPFDAAAQLNEFIETLCKQTGHSKIALIGESQGACTAMTYVKEYGTKRLDSLVIINGAWQGLTLVGQLFTKQFDVSGPALVNYLSNGDDGGLLPAGLDVLRAAGLLDFVSPLSHVLYRVLAPTVFPRALLPVFGQMPAIWTFVPDEYYRDAVNAILGNDPKYDVLRARIDKYHYEVMTQAPALVKKAMKDGVKVSIIASYGMAPMPFTPDSAYQSDGLIDSAREAGGATYAPLGQALPPSDSKYRSPDGVFDAATCLLPDQTWFIKYNDHDAGAGRDLIQWIIHSKKQPTVWQNPDYPQYLQRTEDKKAIPLGVEPPPAPPASLPEANWAFTQALLGQVF